MVVGFGGLWSGSGVVWDRVCWGGLCVGGFLAGSTLGCPPPVDAWSALQSLWPVRCARVPVCRWWLLWCAGLKPL